MIIPPLIGALLAKKDNLELRYIAGYLGILGKCHCHQVQVYLASALSDYSMIISTHNLPLFCLHKAPDYTACVIVGQ